MVSKQKAPTSVRIPSSLEKDLDRHLKRSNKSKNECIIEFIEKGISQIKTRAKFFSKIKKKNKIPEMEADDFSRSHLVLGINDSTANFMNHYWNYLSENNIGTIVTGSLLCESLRNSGVDYIEINESNTTNLFEFSNNIKVANMFTEYLYGKRIDQFEGVLKCLEDLRSNNSTPISMKQFLENVSSNLEDYESKARLSALFKAVELDERSSTMLFSTEGIISLNDLLNSGKIICVDLKSFDISYRGLLLGMLMDVYETFSVGRFDTYVKGDDISKWTRTAFVVDESFHISKSKHLISSCDILREARGSVILVSDSINSIIERETHRDKASEIFMGSVGNRVVVGEVAYESRYNMKRYDMTSHMEYSYKKFAIFQTANWEMFYIPLDLEESPINTLKLIENRMNESCGHEMEVLHEEVKKMRKTSSYKYVHGMGKIENLLNAFFSDRGFERSPELDKQRAECLFTILHFFADNETFVYDDRFSMVKLNDLFRHDCSFVKQTIDNIEQLIFTKHI
jgi:hypothetical protein